MIDDTFEDRLIDRIAVREAIASLPVRRQQILRRYVRYGETLQEVGAHEGITGARVNQIYHSSIRHIHQRLARLEPVAAPVVQPRRTIRTAQPVAFDKAEFLRHMQRLIELRVRKEDEVFEREHAELERMLADEKAHNELKGDFAATLKKVWPTELKVKKVEPLTEEERQARAEQAERQRQARAEEEERWRKAQEEHEILMMKAHAEFVERMAREAEARHAMVAEWEKQHGRPFPWHSPLTVRSFFGA